MKAVVVVALLACGSSAGPRFPSTPNGRAAQQVYAVTLLERVDTDAIARLLGTRVVAAKAEGTGRTLYRFEPTSAFSTIELTVTHRWQFLKLAGFELAMSDLDPIVIDAPYDMDHVTGHASDFSIYVASIDHRFGLGHSSLTLSFKGRPRGGSTHGLLEGAVHDSIGQVADAPERARGAELYVHWPNKVDPKHPTLRAFRAWAKANP
jgi:hypothetical protein